jgi:hypothetical protein
VLTLIEARTLQGTLLSLPLGDVSGGYSVQDVDGLDPVDATIISSDFAGTDGEQYQSSSVGKRNIVLTLGLESDYVTNSVRGLRRKLYNFFLPKSWVSLRFYDDDGLTVDIPGRVETCKSKLFSQEPQAEVSILCFDPEFVNVNTSSESGSTVNSTTNNLYQYDGDIATGFVLTLNVNQTLTEFTVYNTGEDGIVHSLDIQASLLAGDVVTISTVEGNKYVRLTRSGITSSLLYGMTTESDWVQLTPGDNHFRVYITGATSIPYTITYTELYGGL